MERIVLIRSAVLELRKSLIELGVWDDYKKCFCAYHKLHGDADDKVLRCLMAVASAYYSLMPKVLGNQSVSALHAWVSLPYEVKKLGLLVNFSYTVVSFSWGLEGWDMWSRVSSLLNTLVPIDYRDCYYLLDSALHVSADRWKGEIMRTGKYKIDWKL